MPGVPAQCGRRRERHRGAGISEVPAEVIQRLEELRKLLPLRLYALVDGALYKQRRAAALAPAPGLRALFDGTADATLADAGPWLIDTEVLGATVTADLARLEREAPAVTWLIAPQNLTGLSQLLSLLLDVQLPDGRTALLRFWDPRVLAKLAVVMDGEQREHYFSHIQEWHFLHNDQRVWIGRQHVNAQ
jgi:hypothetical protein